MSETRVSDERLAEIVSDDTVKYFGIGHEEVRAIVSELQSQRQILQRMAEALAEYREAVK